MLEKIPRGLGHALRGVRAGFETIASETPALSGIEDVIALESPAFEDGGSIPPRHTADGEGLSPPLSWSAPPPTSKALVLLVEDPDAPSPEPLVHLLAWDLPPTLRTLPEGQFASPDHGGLDEVLGRNAPDFHVIARGVVVQEPEGVGRRIRAGVGFTDIEEGRRVAATSRDVGVEQVSHPNEPPIENGALGKDWKVQSVAATNKRY